MSTGPAAPIIPSSSSTQPKHRVAWLYALFFFSGFPALIYQIVWQRALFAIYGINVESVTVVVSAFMLGLGLGSLLGGYVSTKPGMPLLAVFGIAELCIAVFGFCSLGLFRAVANWTGGISTTETGLMAFALVVIPTILMGGTLPVLVEYLVRILGNVGRSVGILYFVNTLGSAAACFVAAKVLLRFLGMSGSVAVAASINATIGSLVLIVHFRNRGREYETRPAEPVETGRPQQLIPFAVGLTVAGLAGFISLSYEILWYRIYSFGSFGTARSFEYMLGFFLAGIAFGSLFSRSLCRRVQRRERYLRTMAALVIISNLLGYLLIPIVSRLATHVPFRWTFPLVAITAALLGATFPLVCHISVKPDERAGARLSYLYISNIVGSVAGSLLVGFVLMDVWGAREISVMLALLGLTLGLALWTSGEQGASRRTLAWGATAMAAAAVVAGSGYLFHDTYERLQRKYAYQPGSRFRHIVENKSGVITVDDDGTIYGGGVYDGAFNTDLIRDQNHIFRAFAISAFHAAPRTILSIGLASGSWAQILANHPQVERLTIIEINPGYTALVAQYPDVAGLLRNPKVEIVIDDGRRWLVHHPERKFDVVVSNTSFSWRSHNTNLLSTEFLGLIRRHLKPGGVHYYNATGSNEAFRTGAFMFPYALRVGSFLAVSDQPLTIDIERWQRSLAGYRIDGKAVINPANPEDRKELARLRDVFNTVRLSSVEMYSIEYGDSILRRTQGNRIITDDNTGTEYLY